MNLLEKIKAANGDRGRLESLLVSLVPEKLAPPNVLVALAEALLAVGAFAQVLELKALSDLHAPGKIQPMLASCAGTAAANLGLVDAAVESLQQAAEAIVATDDISQIEQVFAALGRLYKQRALDHLSVAGLSVAGQAADQALVRADLVRALEAYREAFHASSGIWSGINVATLHFLLGERSEAKKTARRLLHQLDQDARDLEQTIEEVDLQWRIAVRAEAALLIGDDEYAGQQYEIASAMARRHFRFAHITSMRRQARLILQAREHDFLTTSLSQSDSRVDIWMPPPVLLVFSGHRLDSADATTERFPATSLAAVRARIDTLLKDRAVRVAFCALSEGADLLFAQAALQAGLELNVVLASDQLGLAKEWLGLGLGDFASAIMPILAGASKVYALAPEGPTGSAVDYRYANEILLGSAMLRARECEARLEGVAVWDRLPARGLGGTASMVQQMLSAKMRVQIIDPIDAQLRLMECEPVYFQSVSADAVSPAAFEDKTQVHQIKALLFADFVGYSKLNTEKTHAFVERALPLVARVLEQFEQNGCHVSVRNTWGDGLFLVFDSALDAAQFALSLQAQLAILAPELSFPLKLRIALHYAPVMMTQDPISQRPNAIGPSVSRASRLEPATAPGAVYASEALASQLVVARGKNIPRCRYLANLPWAKGYGSFPTYVLEANDSASE